jgi:hypothetical protein
MRSTSCIGKYNIFIYLSIYRSPFFSKSSRGILFIMKFLSTLFFITFLLPLTSSAAGVNAGFVQGLWYNHDPFFASSTVRVYVAIRNNAEGDLTGTIRFTDNGIPIDEVNVSAVEGKVIDTWVDWVPSYGAHKIEAELINVFIDGTETDITNASTSHPLAEDVRIVDYDTDGDGIGNEDDTDDDGDGISDIEELENGSDPLVFNEPEVEETEEEKVREDTTKTEEVIVIPTEAKKGPPNNGREGLETFFDDGITKTALGAVTQVSNTIKDDIDAYRETRAPEPATYTATSTLEDGTVIESTVSGGTSQGTFSKVLDGIYGFFLFILSLFFTYPGVVQLTLLVLTLFFIYKTARRCASRPLDQ